MAKIDNLLGRQFGRLTVIGFAGRNRHRHILWLCECSCDGRATVVASGKLKSGRIKSCGCHRAEYHKNRLTKHGLTRTVEYNTWSHMRRRCVATKGKDYRNYVCRGITVCERWQHSFEAFYEDMGPRPGPGYSIDRINNDGNYEPGNCRWATHSQQMRNRRPFKCPRISTLN